MLSAIPFVDVSLCHPPTCPIAFERMKRSHEFKHCCKPIQASSVSFFTDVHQRKNQHGIFHLRSLQNIMEEALTHHACDASWSAQECRRSTQGSPQCAQMEWKDPNYPRTMPVTLNRLLYCDEAVLPVSANSLPSEPSSFIRHNLLRGLHGVKYMLSNCSEMFIFGKNWMT